MELKKGETILTDASLHLPAACLRKAFSDRSGVPADHFELYYRGKRLEGEAALASWGVEKDATIEVKMRGRGGGCVGAKEASSVKKAAMAAAVPQLAAGSAAEALQAVTEAKPKSRREMQAVTGSSAIPKTGKASTLFAVRFASIGKGIDICTYVNWCTC